VKFSEEITTESTPTRGQEWLVRRLSDQIEMSTEDVGCPLQVVDAVFKGEIVLRDGTELELEENNLCAFILKGKAAQFIYPLSVMFISKPNLIGDLTARLVQGYGRTLGLQHTEGNQSEATT
jgi:hypothetical protein